MIDQAKNKPREMGIRFPGTAGNIFGVDNGNGPKKQPRNRQCSCGSGVKAKHCHVYEVPFGSPPLEEMRNEERG